MLKNDFIRRQLFDIQARLETIERLLQKPGYTRIVSPKDFCTEFSISTRTLHNWIKKGLVKSRKVGRRRYILADTIRITYED